MNILLRIMELAGCDRQRAIRIELAARLLNKQEQLRTVEDLREDEVDDLIRRAVAVDAELSSRVRAYLEGDGRKGQ